MAELGDLPTKQGDGGDIPVVDPSQPTAALLVNSYGGVGIHTLLNQQTVATGSAALLPGTAGPYAAWMADSDRIARTDLEGLWASCSSRAALWFGEGSVVVSHPKISSRFAPVQIQSLTTRPV